MAREVTVQWGRKVTSLDVRAARRSLSVDAGGGRTIVTGAGVPAPYSRHGSDALLGEVHLEVETRRDPSCSSPSSSSSGSRSRSDSSSVLVDEVLRLAGTSSATDLRNVAAGERKSSADATSLLRIHNERIGVIAVQALLFAH